VTESTKQNEITTPSLDAFVDAFEEAWNAGKNPDVSEFLPSSGHTEFEAIATELLCIDLEFQQRGNDASQADTSLVDAYCKRFPEILSRYDVLAKLAFEDYRCQLQNGKIITPGQYADQFQIDTKDWPAPPANGADTHAVAKGSTVKPAEDSQRRDRPLRMPNVGTQLHNFELVEQLGEGQFGRAYLAKQKDLANRLVVVKVSTDLWNESDKLAKLQHPNIVPIYSVHQDEDAQTVCMPFLGRFTLKDCLQWLADERLSSLSGRSYLGFLSANVATNRATDSAAETQLASELKQFDHEQLCLWFASRMAAGVAHAHERGILHRDLKPANVLLTDEGQPMILDFNLSQDIEPNGRSSRLVGGTLPYMAPEHVRAVATGEATDVQADVYSLGVILFQLLSCGQLPFPVRSGDFEGSVAETLADRLCVPNLDTAIPISDAAKGIVKKCLEPKPANRYQTALELQEDLERHLSHRPLKHVAEPISQRCKKWIRRHPQVRSTGFLALVAGLIIAVVASVALQQGTRLADMHATKIYANFIADADDARASLSTPSSNDELHTQAVDLAGKILPAFDVAHLDANKTFARLDIAQQLEVRQRLVELHFLLAFSAEARATALEDNEQAAKLEYALAQNALASQAIEPSTWAVAEQRASILRKLGREAETVSVLKDSVAPNVDAPFDRYLTSLRYFQDGKFQQSKQLLQPLVEEMPKDFFASHMLGNCYEELGELAAAEECFTACKTLSPNSLVAYFDRGTTRLKREEYGKAKDDFDYVVKHAPDSVDALINRAYAWRGLRKYKQAISDLNAAEPSGRHKTRIHLLRSKLWKSLGDKGKSDADLQAGIQSKPDSFEGWLGRGLARLPNDVDGAIADIRQSLRLQPHARTAMHNLAVVLADHKKDYPQAIEVYDRLISANAKDVKALRGRAVVQARLGNGKQAVTDLAQVFKLDKSAQTHFQAACVYSLLSKDDEAKQLQAVALLKKSLHLDGAMWHRYAKQDDDLAAVRDLPAFQKLIAAADLVHGP